MYLSVVVVCGFVKFPVSTSIPANCTSNQIYEEIIKHKDRTLDTIRALVKIVEVLMPSRETQSVSKANSWTYAIGRDKKKRISFTN